jgi:hypothetical protein
MDPPMSLPWAAATMPDATAAAAPPLDPRQLHTLDLNGDNRTDFVLYNPSTGAWYQARNLTLGTFSYNNGAWAAGLTMIVKPPAS